VALPPLLLLLSLAEPAAEMEVHARTGIHDHRCYHWCLPHPVLSYWPHFLRQHLLLAAAADAAALCRVLAFARTQELWKKLLCSQCHPLAAALPATGHAPPAALVAAAATAAASPCSVAAAAAAAVYHPLQHSPPR